MEGAKIANQIIIFLILLCSISFKVEAFRKHDFFFTGVGKTGGSSCGSGDICGENTSCVWHFGYLSDGQSSNFNNVKCRQLLVADGQSSPAIPSGFNPWGEVVDSWELFLKKDSSLDYTTNADYIAALHNHTYHWWHKRACQITAFEIRDLLNQFRATGSSYNFLKRKKMVINLFTDSDGNS